MMIDPRSFTELTNSNLSQDRWIDLAVDKLIDPMSTKASVLRNQYEKLSLELLGRPKVQ